MQYQGYVVPEATFLRSSHSLCYINGKGVRVRAGYDNAYYQKQIARDTAHSVRGRMPATRLPDNRRTGVRYSVLLLIILRLS